MTHDNDLVSRAEVIIHAAMCKMVPVERHPEDSAIVRKWAREAATDVCSAMTTEAGDGWRPIETAPKNGTRFLGFWPSMDDWEGQANEYETRTWWENGRWHTPHEFSDEHQAPTHWRPLPAPPATEGEA